PELAPNWFCQRKVETSGCFSTPAARPGACFINVTRFSSSENSAKIVVDPPRGSPRAKASASADCLRRRKPPWTRVFANISLTHNGQAGQGLGAERGSVQQFCREKRAELKIATSSRCKCRYSHEQQGGAAA